MGADQSQRPPELEDDQETHAGESRERPTLVDPVEPKSLLEVCQVIVDNAGVLSASEQLDPLTRVRFRIIVVEIQRALESSDGGSPGLLRVALGGVLAGRVQEIEKAMRSVKGLSEREKSAFVLFIQACTRLE